MVKINLGTYLRYFFLSTTIAVLPKQSSLWPGVSSCLPHVQTIVFSCFPNFYNLILSASSHPLFFNCHFHFSPDPSLQYGLVSQPFTCLLFDTSVTLLVAWLILLLKFTVIRSPFLSLSEFPITYTAYLVNALPPASPGNSSTSSQ